MKTLTTSQGRERKFDQLSDIYSEDQAVEEFYYLTVKSRGKHTSEKAIRTAHRTRKMGALIRKFDPTLFYTE